MDCLPPCLALHSVRIRGNVPGAFAGILRDRLGQQGGNRDLLPRSSALEGRHSRRASHGDRRTGLGPSGRACRISPLHSVHGIARARCLPRCSGLQSKWVRTAISAFSGPHYLHLSPTSGPHYMRLSLQSSGRDCNPSPQDRIICN
jgi:hypothetical protein